MDYDINTPRTNEHAQRHLPLRVLVLPYLTRPASSHHSSFAMRFKVGDIIHNKTNDEEGRIVRIADLPGYGACYIVAIAPNPIWGTTAKEAVWKPSEVSARD
jgi:hypothetical protein